MLYSRLFRSLLQKQTIRSREILYFATIKSNRSNSPLEKRRKRRNSRLPTAILVERSQSGGEMFSSGSLKTRKRRGRKKGVVHQRWRKGGKWPCNTGRYRLAHRASARTPCPNFQDTKEAHTRRQQGTTFVREHRIRWRERESIAESVLLLLPLICHRHLARKVCHS